MPQAAESSARARPIGQAVALVVALALLLGIALRSTRGRAGESGRAANLALQSLIGARAVYALSHASPRLQTQADLPKQRRQLLLDLEAVARTRSPRAIRRLALMQHALGEPGWRDVLLRLIQAGGPEDPFEAERELGLWREVLENHAVSAGAVPALRDQVERLDPGWFGHLALESLYRNAGMAQQAESESRAAIRSYGAIELLSGAGLLVGLVGLGLGIAALAAYLRHLRHPDTALPAWLRRVEAEALTPEQASALQAVFISYLAAYAVIQLGVLGILWPLVGGGSIRLSQSSGALLSLGLLALWLAVPYAVYRRLGWMTGLSARLIGFRSLAPLRDVAYGIGGYAVALPILGIVTVASSWAFRGVDSPLNPAVTQFAASRSTVIHFLLFAQAAIIAPVVEETLFRGVLFRSLSLRVGGMGAMVIASAVFAALHPQLPVGFLGIFALGMIFNGLSFLRGSLVPSMTAHAINNAVIFTLLMIVLGS